MGPPPPPGNLITVKALVSNPLGKFRKVVTTRAGRLQEWALVNDHVIKQ